MITWSTIQWNHFDKTFDFAIYYQAAYLIAHGHWSPFSTILNFPFIQNDFELVVWPIAALLWIFQSGFVLPLIQDVAISCTTLIAFLWIGDIVNGSALTYKHKLILTLLGAIILVATPWYYYAASFDFHIEPVILPFSVLAGRNFWKGHFRRGWIWAALTVLGGNVTITYLAGLGLMNVVRGRRYLINGILLIVTSVTLLVMIEKFIPIQGGNLTTFYGAYVAHNIPLKALNVSAIVLGALKHPGLAASQLWLGRWNILGTISPAGLIGLASPMGIGVPSVILLSNNLITASSGFKWIFSAPSYFQSLPASPFISIGTVWLLVGALNLLRRYQRLLLAFVVLLGFNTIIWAALWIPRIPAGYGLISTGASRALSFALKVSPSKAEVVADQSFIGRFSARAAAFVWFRPNPHQVAVLSRSLVFAISPYDGVVSSSVPQELNRLRILSELPNSRLEVHHSGVWVFSWHAPKRLKELRFPAPGPETLLPAWGLTHPQGDLILLGKARDWHVSSIGSAGYIVNGLFSREPLGTYETRVRISTTTASSWLQVWNATGSTLLMNRELPSTGGKIETFSYAFMIPHHFPHPHFFEGVGPWRITPPSPPPNNQIELEIYTTGHGTTNVYGLNVTHQSTSSSS